MDIAQFCRDLRERLIPGSYKRVVGVDESPPVLLLASGRLLGRYALAVFPWEDHTDGDVQLRHARRKVADLMIAFPVFAEVGLYLIFVGPEAEWSDQAESMPADMTGLHRVIVQAVHLVDLDKGVSHLNQSAWGPVKFGGAESVADIVRALIA